MVLPCATQIASQHLNAIFSQCPQSLTKRCFHLANVPTERENCMGHAPDEVRRGEVERDMARPQSKKHASNPDTETTAFMQPVTLPSDRLPESSGCLRLSTKL